MEDARGGEEELSVGAGASPIEKAVAVLDQGGEPSASAKRGRMSLRRQPWGTSSRTGSVRQDAYEGLHANGAHEVRQESLDDRVEVDTVHIGPDRPA